ncbi:MAG TPA: right-handed parallel beta-helix repeat-containing protein [Candidatus Polarisedimenticolia bacterium]|nr:right-handed parallel beta-helix repeat-containing protein [Candidatus Polarisedimenticolia bacterium]
MARVRPVTALIFAVAALCVGPSSPDAASAPSNLRVDGIAANDHVVSPNPTFCWDFGGLQTNWQVQVDDDAAFAPTGAEGAAAVWFWDSGTQDKGAAGSLRCAVMRGIAPPGSVSRSLDRRLDAVHWRVRVRSGGAWSPWAASVLRVNQPPRAASVEITHDDRPSSDPAVASAAVDEGAVYHVSPEGSDEARGTSEAPFRTLSRAMRALAAGDTLVVRGGLYEESLRITARDGYARGEAGRPIVVRAAADETPVLRAPASGSRTALTIGPDPRMAGWVFEGLTFDASSTAVALHGVRDVTLRGCRWMGSSAGGGAAAVSVQGEGEGVRIETCVFDRPRRVQIDVSAASGLAIVGNEFSGFDGGHAVLVHGGSGGGHLIADNTFRDASGAAGAIELSGGTAGTRVSFNVFSNLRGGPDTFAVRAYRGAGLLVESNVFHRVEGPALLLSERAPAGTYRNNIFSHCGLGLLFQGGASSAASSMVDFNLFHANGADVDLRSASESLLDHAPAGNCFGGQGSSCDPRFENAWAGDFRLRAGSPAVDAGDPFSSVPEGGGQRADIGRFERGAGDPPYDHQPRFVVGDATPRIRFSFADLDTLRPEAPPGSGQARFQVQIDTRPGFDGAGAGPLLDSGAVDSGSLEYTVPEARALPPGDYYVRVRQWDEQGAAGGWSDRGLRFRVTQPSAAPRLASALPAPGAVAGQDAQVTARLVAAGPGADRSSVALFLNGEKVDAAVTGGPHELTLSAAPGRLFPAGSRVSVRIVASSLDPSQPRLDTSYVFTIASAAPRAPSSLRVGR